MESEKLNIYKHVLDSSFKSFGNNTHDGYTKYEVNSNGLRGKKELQLTDGLAAGCSQTFGAGVPEEGTWPKILSNKIGMSISNIGVPGSSTQQIIDNIFSYISTFGMPKYIFLVLPQLWRYRIAVDGSVLKDPYNASKKINFINIRDERVKTYPLVSKRPHDPHDVLPDVTGACLSLEALKYLIVYCKSLGIKLYISTWDVNTDRVLEVLKEEGNIEEYFRLDYIDRFDSEKADYVQDELCHSNSNLAGLPEWSIGLDPGSHMGVHQHLHFAELFEKLVKEETNGQ